MDSPLPQWDVNRLGGTVHVDLSRAAYLSAEDTDAILTVTENLLDDDGVTILQLQGPVLGNSPPKGLARTLNALNLLADRYDKRLVIAPI